MPDVPVVSSAASVVAVLLQVSVSVLVLVVLPGLNDAVTPSAGRRVARRRSGEPFVGLICGLAATSSLGGGSRWQGMPRGFSFGWAAAFTSGDGRRVSHTALTFPVMVIV